jgi:hypothetical protein
VMEFHPAAHIKFHTVQCCRKSPRSIILSFPSRCRPAMLHIRPYGLNPHTWCWAKQLVLRQPSPSKATLAVLILLRLDRLCSKQAKFYPTNLVLRNIGQMRKMPVHPKTSALLLRQNGSTLIAGNQGLEGLSGCSQRFP